jgi:hypothetical protein
LKPFFTLSILITLQLAAADNARADWRVNAQWPELSAELGAAMPNGAGIIVMMSEVDTDNTSGLAYLPEATTATPYMGSAQFAGKTLHAESGVGAASGHAAPVASFFFGNFSSIAAGVDVAHIYNAQEFFDALKTTSAPLTYPGSVQNHSWVNTVSANTMLDPNADTRILRKLDMLIDRDGKVVCVPLNNGSGTTVPILLGNIYNGLTVGLKNGGHSAGGSTVDGTGRMKPDIVAEADFTSLASPTVASASALLLDAIRPAFPDADHPEVVKALLLAGATKRSFPVWQRDASTEPYDDVLGAGELNILNAYHILAAGKQVFSGSAEVSRTGWDYATASSSNARRRMCSRTAPPES